MPIPTGYKKVAELSEFESTDRVIAEVDETVVVLVKLGDDVFCIEDTCTHDGGILSDGEIVDNCLVCSRHGAKFDVQTGAAKSMPATEPTKSFLVHIEDGSIYVKP